MNRTISVIVPVFNTARYLERCLLSIIRQDYPALEILVVDDGSTDGSASICDSFAQQDARIQVIHQKNEGLSSARNTGLDHASGAYLSFVDSDDYIAPDMLSFLYTNLVQSQSDISLCGICLVNEANEPILVDAGTAGEDETNLLEKSEIIKSFLLEPGEKKRINTGVWNKLYKKELFQTLRFPLNRFFEDSFIVFELLDSAERVSVSTHQKYFYVQRQGSISHTSISYNDLIEATENRYHVISEKYPELEPSAKRMLIHLLLDTFHIISAIDSDKNNTQILSVLLKSIHSYDIITAFLHELKFGS